MNDITFKKLNDVYMIVECDEGILWELSEYFTFEVEGAEFSPAYKNRHWDGKIRLLSTRSRKLYVGLLFVAIKYAHENGYTFSIDPEIDTPCDIPTDDMIKDYFVNILDIHSEGKKISPRESQILGLGLAIASKRCVLEAATASGKSLTIYALIRYLETVIPDGKQILLVVPSVGLVHQMFNDFKDYSSNIEWDVEEKCHVIYQGQNKTSSKKILISTYHSIQDQDKKYFERFGAIIGDEAHTFKAKTLKKIMESLTDCPYRYGFTGTLHNSESHRWVVEGLFGVAHKVISAKEMIDIGDATPLNINAVVLNYPTQERMKLESIKNEDANKKKKFAVERKFIAEYQPKNELVCKMGNDLKGNNLILFELKDHGKYMYDMFKEKYDKDVYLVYGKTEGYAREEIKRIVSKKRESVIFASYGVFSTGISIKNLNNLIFGSSPGKSEIRVIQSIGRMLRKHHTKDVVQLYDLVDDLSINNDANFMINHFMRRVELYISEGHPYEVLHHELE
jgi:superfamily II DNA or RNA helicase